MPSSRIKFKCTQMSFPCERIKRNPSCTGSYSMPVCGGCKQACESSGVRTSGARTGGLAFNCAHLVGFLVLGSKLAIPGGLKQNFIIQLQRREGSCELTGSSSGLNSFSNSLIRTARKCLVNSVMSSRGDSRQPTLLNHKKEHRIVAVQKTQEWLHTPHLEGRLPLGTQLESSILRGQS